MWKVLEGVAYIPEPSENGHAQNTETVMMQF